MALIVSQLQLPFKQCQACVNWVDRNDDEIDDMFYENRQTEAPLCSNAWSYKEKCNRKCQKTGLEPRRKDGWNSSDKVLLTILSFFGRACDNVTSLARTSWVSHRYVVLVLQVPEC